MARATTSLTRFLQADSPAVHACSGNNNRYGLIFSVTTGNTIFIATNPVLIHDDAFFTIRGPGSYHMKRSDWREVVCWEFFLLSEAGAIDVFVTELLFISR